MKLHKLAWRGIGRFHDNCELPIDKLGDAALVSISGVNGAGKSTAIEMLPSVLYRETPSRGPVARLANRRDSMITADITTTKRFELRLLLDGVTKAGKSEGVVMPGSDSGKIKDYDAAVAKLVPPQDLFLASGFQAQGGKGRFLDLSASERREMFSAMLGIGHLQVISDKAAARLSAAELQIASLRGQIETLSHQAGGVSELTDNLHAAKDELAVKADVIKDMEKHCDEVRAAQASVKERIAVAQKTAAHAEQDSRRIAEELRETERKLASVEIRLRELDKKLAKKSELEVIAMESDGLQEEIIGIEAKRDEEARAQQVDNAAMVAWQEKLRASERKGSETKSQLVAAEMTEQRVQMWIDDAAKTIATVSNVPCGGVNAFPGCQFLVIAAQRNELLPKKEEELRAAKESVAKAKEALEVARAEYQAVSSKKPAPRVAVNYDRKLVDLRTRLRAANDAAVELAGINQIESEKKSRKKDLVDVVAEVEAKKMASSVSVAQKEEALRSLSTAQGELNEAAIRNTDVAVEQARRSEREGMAAVARLEEQLKAAQKATDVMKETTEKLNATIADQDDWKHLRDAFGPKGIQALEIDASGPEVSSLTNELLSACYGSRFTVSLETTVLKADGKSSKEVFELRVLDNERGTDLPAGDLSGGEKVLVSECLAMALSIFNLQKSDIPILTCFRDEVSGALDADNAVKYIAMLRKAIQLGHLERVYFIAHQPHLWGLADAQITFENGTCHVG